jgi:bifunctional non-homologous end joining protein LigD
VGRFGRHRGYDACLIDDLPALVWVANLAALELHTHQATVDDPTRPTAMVIDLDPGEPAGVLDCCRVALDVRSVLAQLGLEAVVKSSGGKGLHVSVPFNTPGVTAEHTKRLALAIGQLLESHDAKRVTTNMARTERPGRVLLDWSQNDRNKTTIAAYSLRIKARPTVSAPLRWQEVEHAHEHGDPAGLVFEAGEVLERVDEMGDLYAANLTLAQQMPDLG